MTAPDPRVPFVLLVEDHLPDIFLLETAWKDAGAAATLQVARDGQEALERVQRAMQTRPPDLILLDLNLPRLSGFEVLEALKRDPVTKRVPVVIVSTSAADADVARAYDLQVNAYTVKPEDHATRVALVKELERYWLRTAQPAPLSF